jgi:hypothetical protein
MVMYFRLLIFEYILKFKDRLYSNEFSVKIGNLLPAEFENDGGKYSFYAKI